MVVRFHPRTYDVKVGLMLEMFAGAKGKIRPCPHVGVSPRSV